MTGMMSLAEVHAALPGSVIRGDASVTVQRVHTDTRTLMPGDLFVALRGERFDAHDFLPQAVGAGAVAAVAEHGLDLAGVSGVEVPDARLALGQLAQAWRAQKAGMQLIAVTGSNGKTTVTQMLASVLKAHWGTAAMATEGNFNNDIGVPLTLLRLRANHQAAVVELGMNHPGEIAYLTRLAQPTVALVNNAQREHQEFMGTVDAVALENGQVLQSLGSSGWAVYPADEKYADLWGSMAGHARRMRFSAAASTPAEVTLRSSAWTGAGWSVVATTPVGEISFALRLAGEHNVRNSLAVIACALAAGVPASAVVDGLEAFHPVKGRSRVWQAEIVGSAQAGTTLTVVDDTYNANPDSVRAAIAMLATLPSPRLLVLGDMGEVGDQGAAFHAEAGEFAKTAGIEHVLTLGALAAHTQMAFGRSGHFDHPEDLLDAVMSLLPHVQSVLVKGSRFMKMERVIERISGATRPVAGAVT